MSETNQLFSIRKIPYPYQAMLAICSDLDETPDRKTYFEMMRFLNTNEDTLYGSGVGLEIGNSIYFSMPPDQFAYWNTDEAGREMIRCLIQSGHIDCLHSFGDLALTRKDVALALDELTRYGCRLQVWVDHGIAPSNFGRDIMRGRGDIVGSDVYHADLTIGYGIKFVWLGRVSSVIGQDAPWSVHSIADFEHPIASSSTATKELLKGIFGCTISSKYDMHYQNRLMRQTLLRDGRKVLEFIRTNPHWGGVSCCDTVKGLGEVLTDKNLKRLIDRNGLSVLYTHLGKVRSLSDPIGSKTRQALTCLAEHVHCGNLLVTTTQRILNYNLMMQTASLSVSGDNDLHTINITYDGSAKDLEGLTVYVEDPDRVRMKVNGLEISNIVKNGADTTGRKSISIRWNPIKFPHI